MGVGRICGGRAAVSSPGPGLSGLAGECQGENAEYQWQLAAPVLLLPKCSRVDARCCQDPGKCSGCHQLTSLASHALYLEPLTLLLAMQPTAPIAKAIPRCVWRQTAGMHTHTGMMCVTASWPRRIAAGATCSNLCKMVHLSRCMNAQTMCANLLLAWKETQPPPGANTLIGWHICSWRFGAKQRLPAVSAEPSSDSPAELLSRRAVLLPLAESLQLLQQLLHSPFICHCL